MDTGYSHVLAIVNNTVMNMGTCIFMNYGFLSWIYVYI